MTLRQRTPRVRDEAHLAFVRQQPCVRCGKPGPSEAAHLRMACAARGKPLTGMQTKPDDKWTNPLCPYHHRTGQLAQHRMDEMEFWILAGVDPFANALELWKQSGAEARHAQMQPKPRTPKARKPKAAGTPKRKIQGRTEIQSRGFDGRSRPFPARKDVSSERRHRAAELEYLLGVVAEEMEAIPFAEAAE